MAAQKFRQRMHDDVGAVVDRADQIGRRQRVVDDQGHAGLAGDGGDRLDIGDAATGVCNRLDEDRLGVWRDRALEAADIIGVGPHHVPAETLESVGELIDRAAIELARRDELITGLEQHLKHHDLRGMSGSRRQCRGAAFQGGDTFFQHRLGRVSDPGVNISERLQSEQRRGMVGIVEHERRCLIDRRHPRTGGGIGLRACVHSEGGKAGGTIGHASFLFCLILQTRPPC